MISEEDINITKNSLDRCLKDDIFIDRFYSNFLKKSDEIEKLFINTNFNKQNQLIIQALKYMIFFAQNPELELSRNKLNEIAISHNKQHLSIRPDLYNMWLDSMIFAISEADKEYNDDIKASWINILQPSIDYITSFYNKS